MSGRPVRLLAAAAIVAAAGAVSMTTASAGCFSCGSSYSYAAPVVTYQAPVVYSYAPAVTYAAPSCGCGGYAAYQSPMYVVNQGPTYTAPVTIGVEEEPAYVPSYRRAHSYYGEGGPHWRHRHWHRGYGYRDDGYRRHRHGYRGDGYGVRFGYRSGWRARHMVGPGGIWRGSRFAHGPRARFDMPHRVRPMNMHHRMAPGVVNPMGPVGGPKKKLP